MEKKLVKFAFLVLLASNIKAKESETCDFNLREFQTFYENLLTVIGRNESIQPSLQCPNLLAIITSEIQDVKNSSLGDFDLNAAYNVTKLQYEAQIKSLQEKFENDQQNLMDEHEERMRIVDSKMQNASIIMQVVLEEQRWLDGNFTMWQKASASCSLSAIGLSGFEVLPVKDPSICSIAASWFFEYEKIVGNKIVLQRKLRAKSDCTAKIRWFKDTGKSIKKAFRVISAQNAILKMENSYEALIGELKKIHEDALLQIERDNKQHLADSLKELQKLNLNLRKLRTEFQKTMKTHKIQLKEFAAKLIECSLPRAVLIMLKFYDDGNFMEEIVEKTLMNSGSYNPKPVLQFLKSPSISSNFRLQIRGFSALHKSLKLNLHHVAELNEVKTYLLQQTQSKLNIDDGNFIDTVDFDADILTRQSGTLESGQRCHHVYQCKFYEQFLISSVATLETPLVDISSGSNVQVNWFDISENKNIKYLPRNVFRKFPNTEIYTAFKSGVLEIYKNNFYGAEKLQGLWLDHNEIASIESGSFDELRSLEWLYLGFNKLTSIDAQLFVNLNALNSLSLEKNRLTSLPAQVFNSLGNLEWLHLNENPVSSLISDVYFVTNTKLTNKYILNSQV